MVKLTTFWNSPGFSTELTHVYIALDLSPCDRPEAAKEEEQDMTIERFPLADIGRLIAAGEITDAKTLIGLTLAERYLAGRQPEVQGDERRADAPPGRARADQPAAARRRPQGDEGQRVPGVGHARRRVGARPPRLDGGHRDRGRGRGGHHRRGVPPGRGRRSPPPPRRCGSGPRSSAR